MSTGSILSILAYPQYGYHLVCHTGLSLVHCSYLSVGSLHRAHPSWDSEVPTTCPSCLTSPETFAHAILRCPAKEPARTRHLQGVLDVAPDAPVWSSAALLGVLARFIKSTGTAYPPGMFSRPSSSISLVSVRSSNVVSFGYFMSSQES